MLQLYDTLSRKKSDFAAVTGKKPGGAVKLYTCGPTVYHFAHIGNLRTYVWEDVLERTLLMNGYLVGRVMNITDVGHLTSDADEGEDKMDTAAAREGRSLEEIIQFYTDAFVADCGQLNIRIPEKFPRASQHIQAQQELIAKLFEKGLAYDTPEAVYFDTMKFSEYGALSGQRLDQKVVAAREDVVAGENKKNPSDFALWFKLAGRFAHHLQHWPSPWGEGFPGWHVECSALIHEFLGEPIDIHTGGVDHIGTHHANEIAQSEGAYGAPLSRIWMHGEHLLLGEDKMAKSAGNSYVLATIIERGFDPLALRYLCLNAHYRTKLNFSWESLEAAAKGLAGLRNLYIKVRNDARDEKESESHAAETVHLEAFRNALSDDLNTPQAMAAAYKTARDDSLSARSKMTLLEAYDEVLQLGLVRFAAQHESFVVPPEVLGMVEKREEARRNKQFIQADDLRKQVEGLGYTIEDTPSGPLVLPGTNP